MAKKAKRRVVPFTELETAPLMASMRGGTELACALIGGAYVENATGFLLQIAMIDNPVANGPGGLLNNATGILSTASARADMCFCLSLIDELTYDNAKTIAKIRNTFAHSHTPIGFNNVDIQKLCESLEVPLSDATAEQRPTPLSAEKSKRILSVSRYKFVLATLHTLLVVTNATCSEWFDDDKGETQVRPRRQPVHHGGGLYLKTDGKSFPEAGILFDE